MMLFVGKQWLLVRWRMVLRVHMGRKCPAH